MVSPGRRAALLAVSATVASLLATAANAGLNQTDWTGAAGNGLWSDPGNWSSGVPDASTSASIVAAAAPLDLGGGTYNVGRLYLEGDGMQITNGTLAASVIQFQHYSPWISPVIKADLTGVNGELHLAGSNGGIRVEGAISGDIARWVCGAATHLLPRPCTRAQPGSGKAPGSRMFWPRAGPCCIPRLCACSPRSSSTTGQRTWQTASAIQRQSRSAVAGSACV